VRLGPGTRFFSGEDWEIATRIGANGWAGGYFPGPTVEHDHGRRGKHARRRIAEYDIGNGAVCWKLMANPRTRSIYQWHLLRRLVGDLKYRQKKVAMQIYGALLYANERGPARIETPLMDLVPLANKDTSSVPP